MASKIQRTLSVALCGGILLSAASCIQNQVLPADSATQEQVSSAAAASTGFDHRGFSLILKSIVNGQGMVAYKKLQQNPSDLNGYLSSLAKVSEKQFRAWPKQEQIAFLINAYNGYTLRSIIQHKPIRKSIKDIPGVWRFRKHSLLEKNLTLDDIEHRILRKDYNEPRIHAALVCAAISCPPLRREAYTGSILNQQLDDQSKRWLASNEGLQVNSKSGIVSISSIFDWFGEDWERANRKAQVIKGQGKNSAVLHFIAKYRPKEEQSFILSGNYKLKYLPYNWALNQQTSQP